MPHDSTPLSKACTRCNVTRPLSEFRRDPRYKNGHTAWCKPCLSAYAREWRMKNADKERERHRRNRLADPEKHREKVRRSHWRHREERLAYAREYYQQNKERMAEYDRQRWQSLTDEERLVYRERQSRGRASRYDIHIEVVDYAAILARDGYNCHICKTRIEPEDPSAIEFDHIVPVGRGGSHTTDNIAVAHLSCNKRKHLKLMEEIEREGGL